MASEPTSCLRCGSADIIPNARLHVSHQPAHVPMVSVYEEPDAWIFKYGHDGFLRVAICGQCGHVEHWVSNAQELFQVYQRSKKS